MLKIPPHALFVLLDSFSPEQAAKLVGGLTADTLTDVIQKGDAKELQKLVKKLPEEEVYKVLKKVHSKAAIRLLQAQPVNF